MSSQQYAAPAQAPAIASAETGTTPSGAGNQAAIEAMGGASADDFADRVDYDLILDATGDDLGGDAVFLVQESAHARQQGEGLALLLEDDDAADLHRRVDGSAVVEKALIGSVDALAAGVEIDDAGDVSVDPALVAACERRLEQLDAALQILELSVETYAAIEALGLQALVPLLEGVVGKLEDFQVRGRVAIVGFMGLDAKVKELEAELAEAKAALREDAADFVFDAAVGGVLTFFAVTNPLAAAGITAAAALGRTAASADWSAGSAVDTLDAGAGSYIDAASELDTVGDTLKGVTEGVTTGLDLLDKAQQCSELADSAAKLAVLASLRDDWAAAKAELDAVHGLWVAAEKVLPSLGPAVQNLKSGLAGLGARIAANREQIAAVEGKWGDALYAP